MKYLACGLMSELEADEYCSTERHHCSLFTHLIVSCLTDEHRHWEPAEHQQGVHVIVYIFFFKQALVYSFFSFT